MNNFIELYNKKVRKSINYDINFSDIKDKIFSSNCGYYIITIKDGYYEEKEFFKYDLHPISISNYKRNFFRKMAVLYPDLNVKFLYTPNDCIIDEHAGMPLFAICSNLVNGSNEFLGIDLYRDGNQPFKNIARSNNSSFKEKDKKCFFAYNASILPDLNNIKADERTKLLLESERLNFLEIIPFCENPETIQKYEEQGLKEKIRKSEQIQELIDKQYQSRTNFLLEGLADISLTRYMNALFNNGNMIRLGRKKYYNIFDLFCELTGINLFYADSEKVDENLIKKAEESLEDDSLITIKNKITRQLFTEENIFKSGYETLKSYKDIFGYKLENK